METFERQFLNFIEHYASCIERLNSFKIPEHQLGTIFQQLDRSKKGFIDVSDLYEVDHQITEDELFFIFKWIDCLRCGYITLQDFRKNLQSSSGSLAQIDDPFKNFMKVLKATYYSIEKKKKDSRVNEMNLCRLYENVQKFVGKLNLNLQDFIHYFQRAFPNSRNCLQITFNKMFANENLTIGIFVDSLKICQGEKQQKKVDASLQYGYTQKRQPYFERQYLRRGEDNYFEQIKERPINAENYTANIDQILKKYDNRSSQGYGDRNSNYGESFVKQQESPSYLINFNHQVPKPREEITNERTEKIYKEAEKLLDCEGVRNRSLDIQKRKQELRKGSLERKKIIEQIMNKKYTTPFRVPHQQSKLCLDRKYYTDGIQKNIQKKPSKKFPQTHIQNTQDFERLEEKLYSKKSPEPLLDRYCQEKQEIYSRSSPYQREQESYMRPPLNLNFNNTFESSFSTNPNLYHSKSSLKNFYRRPGSENYDNSMIQKENILKRAQEEATRKIQEIERKARMKIMEKKSSMNGYGKWLK